MRQSFVETASALLESDARVAVVLADIGVSQFEMSDRVVNVGIREQTLIGASAGLALSGLRPIAHTYAPFLIERAFEQIKLDLGHQSVGAVLVSIGASFDAAKEGRTHQSPGDVALMSSLPGWTIHVPGHAAEVEAMLRQAVTSNDRIYIRLAEDQNSQPNPVNRSLSRVRTGSARGATVIAVGPMLDRVVAATSDLDVTVVYTATIRPFDSDGLRATASGTDVVLVEPYLEGTSAVAVAKALVDRPHRLLSVGVPNAEHRRYGSRDEHAAAHELDIAGLRRRISAFADSSH